jgi:hypothetical protein
VANPWRSGRALSSRDGVPARGVESLAIRMRA